MSLEQMTDSEINVSQQERQTVRIGAVGDPVAVEENEQVAAVSPTDGEDEEEVDNPEIPRIDNYNDTALDESINFFRVQQRYEFDSDSTEENICLLYTSPSPRDS